MNIVKRGDLFYADLNPIIGSEQGGLRPVIIIQNNTGNRHSPTVIVAPITISHKKPKLPIHVNINSGLLKKNSIVLCEQLRTIDKKRLHNYIGRLNEEIMDLIGSAVNISLELNNVHRG